MAMFPIFIIGLLVGILLGVALTNLYFYYRQTAPTEVKFRIQEATIISLQEDIKTLESTNEKLLEELDKLKTKKTTRKTTKK